MLNDSRLCRGHSRCRVVRREGYLDRINSIFRIFFSNSYQGTPVNPVLSILEVDYSLAIDLNLEYLLTSRIS